MFSFDEIKKQGGWNDKGQLFIPESCYECVLMEDVPFTYSRCRADMKDIPMPYEKCAKDCPLKRAIHETKDVQDRPNGDIIRRLHILKVLSSAMIIGADEVIQAGIDLIEGNTGTKE